jgi:hypothetical protein
MRFRILGLGASGLVFGVILALATGCGGSGGGVSKVTVTGTVSYDGKPVQSGTIEFFLQEASLKGGGNAQGAITNGKFSVANVTPGKNKVTVASTASTSEGMVSGSYTNRPKMPDMSDPMKAKKEMEQRTKGTVEIPQDAVGNGQIFDITPNMAALDIKLMKK